MNLYPRRFLWCIFAGLVGVAGITYFVTQTPYSQIPEDDAPAVVATTTSSEAVFGGVSLMVEYATTSAARAKGLSGRASLPENHGMLFVFEEPGLHGFWMKDTLISLDIFWLNDKGQVVSVVEWATPESYPHVFYPRTPARYVLETVAGFAQMHNIATGTVFQLKNIPNVP